jgi:hypothetical protein
VLLSGANGGVSSRIGDPFRILPSGLTTALSNEVIWRQITNRFNGPIESHPPYQLTDLVQVVSNENQAYLRTTTPDLATARLTHCADPATLNPNSTANNLPRPFAALPLIPRDFGTCNSMRNGWGWWERFEISAASPSCLDRIPDVPPGITLPEVPVWRVKAAVIANRLGQGCSGIAASSFDPAIAGNDPYEVIGFVDLHVYDVDIGRDAPSYQNFASYAHPCGATAGYRFEGAGMVTERYPWGFQRTPGTPNPGLDRCNLVRTRIVCDTEFIPSSENSGPSKPSLVQ